MDSLSGIVKNNSKQNVTIELTKDDVTLLSSTLEEAAWEFRTSANTSDLIRALRNKIDKQVGEKIR